MNTEIRDFQKKGKNVRINLAITVGFLALFCLIMYLLIPHPYITNDQVLMRDIVSGKYTGTPDGHMIYILFPLGMVLAGLYRIFPLVNWYDILIFSIIPVCYAFLTYRVLSCFLKISAKIPAAVSMLIFMVAGHFAYYSQNEYTYDAALLAAVGILFWSLYDKEVSKSKLSDVVIGIIFFVMALFIRKNVFFMSLPILAVILLVKILLKKIDKKMIIGIICLGAVSTVFLSLDAMAYSGDDWQNFLEYNKARTSLVDYSGWPSYEDEAELLETMGISREEYAALPLAMEIMPNITADQLTAIAHSVNERQEDRILYIKRILRNDCLLSIKESLNQPIFILMLSLGVLQFYCSFLIKEKKKAAMARYSVILLALYVVAFIVYFNYLGRCPMRVLLGLYIMVFAAIGGIYISLLPQINKKIVLINSLTLLLVTLSIAPSYIRKGLNESKNWNLFVEENNQLHQMLSEDEKIYLIEPQISYFKCKELLDGSHDLKKNVINTCFWTAGSPLDKERLQNIGFNIEDINSDDDILYVSREGSDVIWLENLCNYYAEGKSVYRFVPYDKQQTAVSNIIIYQMELCGE